MVPGWVLVVLGPWLCPWGQLKHIGELILKNNVIWAGTGAWAGLLARVKPLYLLNYVWAACVVSIKLIG